MSNLDNIIARMEKEVENDSFIEAMDNCVAEIKASGMGIEAVEPLLKLMERHPFSDFGMPGSIVHFVESFYKQGYEELLAASVQRRPTMHTVWMVNRIKNSESNPQKYIDLLCDVIEKESVEKELKQLAQGYLSD